MLDVDYFKAYNDGYGHLKGDEVLKTLVNTLKQQLPESGFFARYGGEEFAILIDNISLTEAQVFAEQCLNAVQNSKLEHAYRLDAKEHLSLSIGGTVLENSETYSNIIHLMKAADQNLYKAKIKRSCVVVQ